jgi:hypothetical protein
MRRSGVRSPSAPPRQNPHTVGVFWLSRVGAPDEFRGWSSSNSSSWDPPFGAVQTARRAKLRTPQEPCRARLRFRGARVAGPDVIRAYEPRMAHGARFSRATGRHRRRSMSPSMALVRPPAQRLPREGGGSARTTAQLILTWNDLAQHGFAFRSTVRRTGATERHAHDPTGHSRLCRPWNDRASYRARAAQMVAGFASGKEGPAGKVGPARAASPPAGRAPTRGLTRHSRT